MTATLTQMAGEPLHRDLRWNGRPVRVTTPVPAEVWRSVAAADPTTMPFQTPVWRDCVAAASGWRDASRLYETAGGRQLVLMLARKGLGRRLAVEASWPPGWGAGGVLAPGGVRPEEAELVCADLARGRALSASVRPGFGAAPAWPVTCHGGSLIGHSVHVVRFAGPFEEFWASRVTPRTRAHLRSARRHLERAGIVITSGNSPELVAAFYDVYLRWIGWRARQRRVPAGLAAWQGRRVDPYRKFSDVAAAFGQDCRIRVAWWESRPVAASVTLYSGEAAVDWRSYTDRSVPSRFRLPEVLQAEVLRHACESGRRYVELGESVGQPGLASVKTRFGAAEHVFAEYCFERVPLSAARLSFQRARRHAEDVIIGHGRWAGPRRHRGTV